MPNQRLPSAPVVMPPVAEVGGREGRAYSVTVPPVVIFPIFMPSPNQRLPSGPLVMPTGPCPAPRAYSVKVPELLSLAIFPLEASVIHKLPSGPAVMPVGLL